ncbi:hypothetical protein [Paenibacillus sp. N3.4]|uniref:hypothetical protein n=1 Tax=Paenibacillus sp. N3.4 TaxID=2603222 RepID=UPI00164F43E1|nr:hypothetical protein [Paenibacillus sp. N3.4]
MSFLTGMLEPHRAEQVIKDQKTHSLGTIDALPTIEPQKKTAGYIHFTALLMDCMQRLLEFLLGISQLHLLL